MARTDELDLLGSAGAQEAALLEAADPVISCHDRFLIPEACLPGRQLPRSAGARLRALDEVLRAWSSSAVDAHLEGDYPWAPYHETMRETGRRWWVRAPARPSS